MTYPKGYKSMPDQSSDTYERITTGKNEITIWSRILKKGFFRKRVIGTEKVTNYAVHDSKGNTVFLNEISDIVIMNQHGRSQGQFMAASSGRGGTRTSFGQGFGRSSRVGDLTIIVNGVPSVVFKDVMDPSGLAGLIKAAQKALTD